MLVLGHAYASPGPPCSQVDVGVRLGPVDRRLRVWGDRMWRRGVTGLALSRPEPFMRIPLVYERAFGGGDAQAYEPRNPAGVGFAASRALLVDTPAPNIEDPNHLIQNPDDRPPPAGLGPIPAHWQPRRGRAGTYDQQWERERMPLVPCDFEDRHYQCGPDEQQVSGHLSGGEAVELHNLTPGGLMRFDLPRVSLDFSTRIAGEPRHHGAELQTVLLEPDRRRVVMVWAAALSCHHDLYTLEGTWVRGGAAWTYPPGPTYNHTVNVYDPVPLFFGRGRFLPGALAGGLLGGPVGALLGGSLAWVSPQKDLKRIAGRGIHNFRKVYLDDVAADPCLCEGEGAR